MDGLAYIKEGEKELKMDLYALAPIPSVPKFKEKTERVERVV